MASSSTWARPNRQMSSLMLLATRSILFTEEKFWSFAATDYCSSTSSEGFEYPISGLLSILPTNSPHSASNVWLGRDHRLKGIDSLRMPIGSSTKTTQDTYGSYFPPDCSSQSSACYHVKPFSQKPHRGWLLHLLYILNNDDVFCGGHNLFFLEPYIIFLHEPFNIDSWICLVCLV